MMIYQLNVLTHAIHIHIFPDFISFSHTLSYSRTLSYPCTFLMFQAAVAFEGDNDRVKLMVLFSGEEDEGLVQAASGALAILSARKSICQKIISVSTTYTGEGEGGAQLYCVHCIENSQKIFQLLVLKLLLSLKLSPMNTYFTKFEKC